MIRGERTNVQHDNYTCNQYNLRIGLDETENKGTRWPIHRLQEEQFKYERIMVRIASTATAIIMEGAKTSIKLKFSTIGPRDTLIGTRNGYFSYNTTKN